MCSVVKCAVALVASGEGLDLSCRGTHDVSSCCTAVALAALKRKKRYEKQLQQIDGTLSTIEFQREALENASTNTEVLNVMGAAAKALKVAHGKMYVRLILFFQQFRSALKSIKFMSKEMIPVK